MKGRKLGWAGIVCLMATALLVFGVVSGSTLLLYSGEISIVGLLALAISLWRRRQWWLLLTAPILLAPFLFIALVVSSCSPDAC